MCELEKGPDDPGFLAELLHGLVAVACDVFVADALEGEDRRALRHQWNSKPSKQQHAIHGDYGNDAAPVAGNHDAPAGERHGQDAVDADEDGDDLLEAVEAESAILPQIVRNEGRPGHQQAETQHGEQDIHSLEYLLKEVQVFVPGFADYGYVLRLRAEKIITTL